MPDKENFLFLAEILKKAIGIAVSEAHIEHDDTNHSNIPSSSSVSSTDEIKPVTDGPLAEKVACF